MIMIYTEMIDAQQLPINSNFCGHRLGSFFFGKVLSETCDLSKLAVRNRRNWYEIVRCRTYLKKGHRYLGAVRSSALD